MYASCVTLDIRKYIIFIKLELKRISKKSNTTPGDFVFTAIENFSILH